MAELNNQYAPKRIFLPHLSEYYWLLNHGGKTFFVAERPLPDPRKEKIDWVLRDVRKLRLGKDSERLLQNI